MVFIQKVIHTFFTPDAKLQTLQYLKKPKNELNVIVRSRTRTNCVMIAHVRHLANSNQKSVKNYITNIVYCKTKFPLYTPRYQPLITAGGFLNNNASCVSIQQETLSQTCLPEILVK